MVNASVVDRGDDIRVQNNQHQDRYLPITQSTESSIWQLCIKRWSHFHTTFLYSHIARGLVSVKVAVVALNEEMPEEVAAGVVLVEVVVIQGLLARQFEYHKDHSKVYLLTCAVQVACSWLQKLFTCT